MTALILFTFDAVPLLCVLVAIGACVFVAVKSEDAG